MSKKLADIARLVRSYILTATTEAGSGHPSSSLSATDLMTVLMFGGFFKSGADRLIFSKGHAAPLFYALYAALGKIPTEELMTLRKYKSRLGGHPSMSLPFTEAATGSLGQGLSVGIGISLVSKNRTYVLLGDSEMAEGSIWEAIQFAAHRKLDNLIAILDVNRLGQRGQTMYGHDVRAYEQRVSAFGWKTIVIDGHNFDEIAKAYSSALTANQLKANTYPTMIIAKTIKGKGVKIMEDKDGWHGKPLSKEELKIALHEL